MATGATFRHGRGRGRHILRWGLVFLLAGVLAWVFWKHLPEQSSKPSGKASAGAGQVQTTAQPVANTQYATRNTQQLKSLLPSNAAPGTASAPTNAPALQSVARERVLRAQLALVRQGISPGSVDGVIGPQTRAAVRAFQQREGLPATGDLDANTWERLAGPVPTFQLGSTTETVSEPALFTNYVVTESDLAALQPLGQTWLAKSQQSRLDYETILELAAEKSQAHPNLIRWLNQSVNWSNVAAGARLTVPNTEFPLVASKSAFVKIYLAERLLQAFDEATNLLAHFPCSIGQKMEQRPVGELQVIAVALRPNYTFDPEVFPESAEGRELARKLILPPGPNNPVGTVWIGLNKPGYGIHGTPRPEQVGRTESHGCFRLANWNAEFLARMAWVGMPVWIE